MPVVQCQADWRSAGVSMCAHCFLVHTQQGTWVLARCTAAAAHRCPTQGQPVPASPVRDRQARCGGQPALRLATVKQNVKPRGDAMHCGKTLGGVGRHSVKARQMESARLLADGAAGPGRHKDTHWTTGRPADMASQGTAQQQLWAVVWAAAAPVQGTATWSESGITISYSSCGCGRVIL